MNKFVLGESNTNWQAIARAILEHQWLLFFAGDRTSNTILL
ncbi:hypothetical protein [Nostoc sp. ChiQUE01b]|nr:hypothetical protein [Nostoc sp. ChiQUE01b]MDZ8264565.1 hypothetical protein [Nostoc sp. ChiQUE01b]